MFLVSALDVQKQSCKAAHHLADAGIAGEHIGILNNSKMGWSSGADLQHAAPFSKVSAVFFILSAALVQPVQT